MKDIYSDFILVEELLTGRECPECGELGPYEISGEAGEYRCISCGYESNVYDDIDDQNYFWDEGLGCYDKEDKAEVFDN